MEELDGSFERIIKNMTPEGLADCLENELKEVFEKIDFLNRKSEAIKASIEKLRKP